MYRNSLTVFLSKKISGDFKKSPPFCRYYSVAWEGKQQLEREGVNPMFETNVVLSGMEITCEAANEVVETIMQTLNGMSLNDALRILAECTDEASARARL